MGRSPVETETSGCHRSERTRQVIFNALHPAELEQGNRVLHLGVLRTVVAKKYSERLRAWTVFFADETISQFCQEIAVVDESRTTQLLARYG
jgi:hypothetical protein